MSLNSKENLKVSNHHDRNSDTEKGLTVFPLECLVWLSLFTCIAFFEIPNASYIPLKSDARFFFGAQIDKNTIFDRTIYVFITQSK